MRNIRQNLVFAFAYNVIGIPVAAGVLYPLFGILLSPVVAARRCRCAPCPSLPTPCACGRRHFDHPYHRLKSPVKLVIKAVLIFATLAAHPASAQQSSTKGFKAAEDRMMGPMTGDADRDFVAGMIPHHQCAIDMVNVELQFGKDPALRRLARGIVEAQESEIARMRAWQAKHPAR